MLQQVRYLGSGTDTRPRAGLCSSDQYAAQHCSVAAALLQAPRCTLTLWVHTPVQHHRCCSICGCCIERACILRVRACRALGGLLAAHAAMLNDPSLAPPATGMSCASSAAANASDSASGTGAANPYTKRMLALAVDLADRLLPAFDTPTGIPRSWINPRKGKIRKDVTDTCVACAGTLALEFRMLTHFTHDPRYGEAADHAVRKIYSLRDEGTGLVGNTLDTGTSVHLLPSIVACACMPHPGMSR
jgi:Glycosyl hydrolase family 47